MAPSDDEFADFMAREYRRLVRSAFVLVGDVQQAEDLVQTALYRTLRRWSHLQSADAASAYARTTMVRLAVRWRSRRWSAEMPMSQLPEPVRPAVDGLVARPDVARALATLPAAQRAVLVLRFMHDLSEAQTAAVLRCSVGTVKSRSSRALNALRASSLLTDDESLGSNL